MNMRNLRSAEDIPFGTLYCRAPSLAPAQGDLARIAVLGLNTVKFWVLEHLRGGRACL